ncbi:hypothetical protein GCM10027176_04190 [Actinoallomurus bryophytorum]|uniref:Uncharacterized protein n=1 Tax=Actinoallomurus bryophytorum TaxID=1490222 RepID=A0A543CJU5_9ACTN|nr:hypothetical protein [Actinoallomurus bryophytorum]TQL97310.1 hypothetical protein FB559_2889 [Actinoallomurus bryophytorum]
MKVLFRTLPALAMGAAGLVATPVFGAEVPVRHDVHLVTLIRALSRTPAAVQYAVTVRPVGGPAHAATLVLSTRRPAAWTGSVPACLASRDRTALACDLGDLRESEARTLRVTVRPGDRGPAEVPVVARAAAANVPSVTSSLGAMRPQALRLAPSADEAASGQPSPQAVAQSPEAQSSPGESPPTESPSAEAPSAEAQVAPSAPAESEAAQSPAIVPPATLPRSAHPQGRVPAAPPRLRVPARPSGSPKAPSAPPAAAEPAPGRLPVVPDAPVIPDAPAAAAPSATGPIGGPPLPLPIVSAPAALPQIAPKTPPGEGVSELSTLSPAGAMQAGRTSWATLVAVAVVAEAGLLWLVAGLTVWRRRRMGGGASRSLTRPRGRSSRALAGRPLP